MSDEKLIISSNGQWSLEKSNYGPKGMGLYNPTDNIKRKSTRTGEVREDAGKNQAVRQYTSSPQGTAAQQADRQSKKDKKLSAKNPVRSMKDMSQEELNSIKARYAVKSDLDDKIAAVKAKYAPKQEKSFDQKVRYVKSKYADKPVKTDDQAVTAVKNKYLNLFKSKDINALIQEVSRRQPTDEEIRLILEYNNNVQRELEERSMNSSISHESDESGY